MAVRYNNSLDLHQTGILCKFLPVAVQNEAKRPGSALGDSYTAPECKRRSLIDHVTLRTCCFSSDDDDLLSVQ